MPGRRPGAYTAIAVLNFVYGGLLMVCAACSGIDMPLEVNRVDVTQDLRNYLNQEIPGFSTLKIAGAVFGVLLGVALIVAGIGLLQVATWGRVLGIITAVLGAVHHVGEAVLQLMFVNPALDRFFARFWPINFSFLPKTAALVVVIGWALGTVYFLIQTILLAVQPARLVADPVAYQEEDWEDRPRRRRRPDRWEDEDEGDRGRRWRR